MIKKRTVLVLGAGASWQYGFPTGPELFKHICEGLYNNQTGLHNRVSKFFNQDEIYEFRTKLINSGNSSVDTFLEGRNNKKYLNIGKITMAAELIPHERTSEIFGVDTPIENSWYHYLFEKMNTEIEKFGSNNLSVITFNYDRSFEFFFLTSLQNHHSIERSEAITILEKMPIIHLHGQLGYLPGMGRENKSRDYTSEIDQKYIEKIINIAAKEIKIIHEVGDDQYQFRDAGKLLYDAERIIFLGFGFNEINVNRLFKHLNLNPDFPRYHDTRFYCCFYKATIPEITEKKNFIREHMKDAEFIDRGSNNDAYNYLRESGALI